jgi:hypothetical protein
MVPRDVDALIVKPLITKSTSRNAPIVRQPIMLLWKMGEFLKSASHAIGNHYTNAPTVTTSQSLNLLYVEIVINLPPIGNFTHLPANFNFSNVTMIHVRT